jgi:hypothetical protein
MSTETNTAISENEVLKFIYKDFDDKTIIQWEETTTNHPDTEWENHKVKPYMPLIKAVRPRLSKRQNIFALTIISIPPELVCKKEVVAYALEPFMKARVLTDTEIEKMTSFLLAEDSIQKGPTPGKSFSIEGGSYQFYFDFLNQYRDIVIRV